MIEAIQYLGKKALSESNSLVEGFVLPLRSMRNQKKQHVVILNYDLDNKEISLSFDEVRESTSVDYLWIGTADGAASPQWYGSVSNVEYLLNQTIPNLLEKWDQTDDFYETFKKVLDNFFIDLGSSKKNDDRYRYVANPKFFEDELQQLDPKKAKAEVTKMFQEFIKKKTGLNSDDIAIYSLAINGELLIKRPEYKELILKEKENVFDGAIKGICAITNKPDLVTGETTKFKFNYYINDKINFASGLEKKNYHKNMAIGKTTYQQIIAGETYVMNKLDTRFGNLPCYVIPEFLYEPVDEQIPISEWSYKIQNLVKTVKTVDTSEKLRSEIRRDMHYQDRYNQVLLNFLFYVKAQSSFKITKLIQHVPMNEIHELFQRMQDIEKIGRQYLGEKGNWKIGLGQIYYLIPMKEQRGDNFEKRKILTVYESLLNRKQISYDWLIKQFISLAKVYHLEQFNLFQIRQQNSDFGMVNAILQSQLLLMLFDQLSLLRGGKNMDKELDFQLNDEELVNYMKEIKYGVAESSMFLLGYLISAVGSEQYKRLNNKAILNKINFQGMSKMKVQSLSIDLFEKLNQYKLLSYNEKIFSEHKRFFDQALLNWRLSDRETVFYILSGYAYGTNRILNYSKGNQQNENEVTQ